MSIQAGSRLLIVCTIVTIYGRVSEAIWVYTGRPVHLVNVRVRWPQSGLRHSGAMLDRFATDQIVRFGSPSDCLQTDPMQKYIHAGE
jgi:hypothetical protein